MRYLKKKIVSQEILNYLKLGSITHKITIKQLTIKFKVERHKWKKKKLNIILDNVQNE